MITAKEAKELYDQSGVEVEEFLKYKVEPEVVKATKGGKRHVFIHLGSIEQFYNLAQIITPLYKAVIDKLGTLGYRAEITLDGDKYVPRGLADDDGIGPLHQNYGIQINW